MFAKVVVADRLSLFVDIVLPNYMHYTGMTCFVASVFYTIQIYADFSGYSLMAIGVGKVLGFELTENFRRPYFAVCVTDFWRRWHISLSTWLKDYVYIPLGGSRCAKWRNYWNIFVASPMWYGQDTLAIQPIKDICKARNLCLLDYTNDPKYVHHDEYFMDGFHLNATGADEFTRDLIKDIRQWRLAHRP